MRLSRRTSLALLGGALATPVLGRVALAAADTDRRLVVVILRGALDGLAAVPPFFDPEYRALRAGLGPAEPGAADGALPLDGGYGLHPALATFHAQMARGEAAIVHAVATPYRERSHFDAQDLLENGTIRARGASDGWLNRALALLGQEKSRRGIAVGQSVPLVIRGPVPVGGWAPQTMPGLNADFVALLQQVYRGDAAFDAALREGLRAHAMSEEVLGDEKGMGRGARGPQAIRSTATAVGRLLAAADGPRIAAMDIGGWDTHSGQNARLAQMLKALDDGLAAFEHALGDAWRRTVIVVATEFGRTARANGTAGTDHGTATVAMLAGGAVAGGKVLGTWPGLAETRLHQGRDLAPTTDLRSVLKGVLGGHLGIARDRLDRTVFPDSADAAALAGLVKA
ncbi:MAG: DUF1501 domain-containing protein [Alphaproteobacteria bacterium]|nr:DUF1501 domain-containing protein [Alphaproteobacteria bacterium]